MTAYTKQLPAPDALSAPFWEGCRQEELRLQRCAGCGDLKLPPRPACGKCLSQEWTWIAASGRGTIWSWTVCYPPVLPAWQDVAPYNVVVIELEEGVKIVSNLLDVAPDAIRPHLPVEVVFEAVTDEVTLPRFRVRR